MNISLRELTGFYVKIFNSGLQTSLTKAVFRIPNGLILSVFCNNLDEFVHIGFD
jgi:hypothetical protein